MKVVLKELDCYEKLLVSFVESGVICNYIDWLLVFLWIEVIEDIIDFVYLEEILNNDYYGFEKVKECVFEYLVV